IIEFGQRQLRSVGYYLWCCSQFPCTHTPGMVAGRDQGWSGWVVLVCNRSRGRGIRFWKRPRILWYLQASPGVLLPGPPRADVLEDEQREIRPFARQLPDVVLTQR